MPDAIGSFSPEAVIEAIEENLVDAAMAMGRTPDGVVLRGSDVAWVYTGYAALNRVLRARFTEAEAEDRVAEIAECFQKWNAPVTWIIGPSTWPPQLPDALRDNGFTCRETTSGLAADLRPALPAPPVIPGFRIELITDAAQFELWTVLNTEPWPGNTTTAAAAILTPENAGSDSRCRFYLGYLNDQPAVRGMVCAKGDVAGLHWIATGAQQHDWVENSALELALANHALTEARDAGATLAIFTTPEPVSPFCQKLRFQIYCQLTRFTWPADGANAEC